MNNRRWSLGLVGSVVAMLLATNANAQTVSLGACEKRAFYDYCSTQLVALTFSATMQGDKAKAKSAGDRFNIFEKTAAPFKKFPALSEKTKSEITATAIKEVTKETLNACSPQNLGTYAKDVGTLLISMKRFCQKEN